MTGFPLDIVPFAAVVFAALGIVLITTRTGAGSINICILLTTAILILFNSNRLYIAGAIKDSIFSVFLLYLIGSILSVYIQYVTAGTAQDAFGRDAYSSAIFAAVSPAIYFLFGLSLRFRTGPYVQWAPLAAMLLLALFVTGGHVGFIDYRAMSQEAGSQATHIPLSDATVLLTFAAVSLTSGWRSVLCALIGITLLFLIQGRTALYIATIAIAAAMAVRRRDFWPFCTVLAVGALVAIGLAGQNSGDVGRMLLTNIDRDGSIQLRTISLRAAINDLDQYLVLGNFRWSTIRFSNWGMYTHNIISYWIQYGAIVFGLFLTTLILVLNRQVRHLVHLVPGIASGKKMDSMEQFRLMFIIYTIVAVFTSKAFVWPWIAMAIGLQISLTRRPAARIRKARLSNV